MMKKPGTSQSIKLIGFAGSPKFEAYKDYAKS